MPIPLSSHDQQGRVDAPIDGIGAALIAPSLGRMVRRRIAQARHHHGIGGPRTGIGELVRAPSMNARPNARGRCDAIVDVWGIT